MLTLKCVRLPTPGGVILPILAAVLVLLGATAPAHAQTGDVGERLAHRWADARIKAEELGFLLRSEQITAAEHQQRNMALATEMQDIRGQLSRVPRDQQPKISQQSESFFQVSIVPLREQWRQVLADKQQRDQARDAARREELMADATKAGSLQAARALVRERLQRGEISQADFSTNDQAAEQEILALQRKYDDYGGSWGPFFSQTVARVATTAVADGRLQARLRDTQSEVGQDAHRAAELTLEMGRNQVFSALRAISPQEAQDRYARAQADLTALQNKYGPTAPAAADFRERVARLVQAGMTERRAQWYSEADAARRGLRAHAAAPVPSAATPAPSSAPVASNATVPPLTRPTAGRRVPSRASVPRAPPPSMPTSRQPRVRTSGQRASLIGLFALPLLVVVLLVAGGGYYVHRRRRAFTSPRYSAVKERHSPPPIAAEVAPRQPAAPPSQPTTDTPVVRGGGLKEQLFADQREKYQARYNDALDAMTSASVELTQMVPLIVVVRNNLKLLSQAVLSRVHALVITRYGNPRKPLMNAAMLMPVFRLAKRGGLLLKIVIGVALVMLIRRSVLLIIGGNLVDALVPYLALTTVFFFIERHLRLKAPLELLKQNAENLKAMKLAYVYDDQVVHDTQLASVYHAIRVSAIADKNSPAEEFTVPVGEDSRVGPGAFLVEVGTIATYRVESNGTVALVSTPATDFMKRQGDLLTEALSGQTTFAENTLQSLARYGQVAWRKRQASEEVPRLEKLVRDVERIETLWRDTYVHDKVFDFLFRRIDLFNVRDSATPPGILLYGYPGNGKVHLAKKIAASISAHFDQADPAKLSSADDVQALWQNKRGRDPVVLFVEYAERVLPRPRSEHEGTGTREATLAWMTEWGKHEPRESRVWVILTAQTDQDLHPAVLTQLGGSKIEIGAPDAGGRELVLRTACRENQLAGDLPGWTVGATGGASIRELRDIVKETKLQSVPNPPTDNHWREAVKSVRGSDAAFKDETKTWDHLVLPAEIKEQLQRACRVLRDADRYKEKGVNVPNILLFGPPGTGKTEIARTFANEGGVKFVMATTADLKAEYVGQSAHRVRDVFAKARGSAPAVLFIDELETVAAKRGSRLADSFTQEIVTEMLQEMDGARRSARQVFVLGATNLPEDIDPAILSRFTSKIEIPLPDEDGRREILKRLIAERAVDPALDVEEISAVLAKRLSRKSGRDLVMLVNRAMERAVLLADSPDGVLLTRDLLFAEVAPQGREVSEADLLKVWAQIVLKQEVKDSLLSKIRLFNKADKAAPRGLLLFGPPGTGKTEIARRIADSTSSYFMALTGSDLKAGYVGQSGQYVKAVWEKARARGRCIMFVDECEGVFARRGSVSTDSASEELVREFLAAWDGVASDGQVWVVGATNRRDQLDEAIVSRFGAAVEIGLPEAAERLEILRLELRKLEREAEIPEFVARATTGFAGRDLATVARDVCTLAAERGGAIAPALWAEVLARYAKASSESVDEDARWDSLILAEDTVETLKTICESLRHVETLRKQGVEPPRGALLYGPPGTGKTQIARTLANESGLPFLAATTSDLKAGFLGQSGQKAHELFERARGKAPCVLFIDEIEAVTPARGSAQADQLTGEIVTQMLQELDGVRKSERHVFVLAATNLPELVDPAILSRFEERIEIPNPGPDQRRLLFRMFLGKQHRVDFDAAAMADELTSRCGGDISGRDIRSLVRRASHHAVQRALKAGTPDQIVLSREDLVSQLPAMQEA